MLDVSNADAPRMHFVDMRSESCTKFVYSETAPSQGSLELFRTQVEDQASNLGGKGKEYGRRYRARPTRVKSEVWCWKAVHLIKIGRRWKAVEDVPREYSAEHGADEG